MYGMQNDIFKALIEMLMFVYFTVYTVQCMLSSTFGMKKRELIKLSVYLL